MIQSIQISVQISLMNRLKGQRLIGYSRRGRGKKGLAGPRVYTIIDKVNRHNIMISQEWPKVGEYVDFKDQDQHWGVGLVVSKTQHFMKIRNEGWGQKHDELIPMGQEAHLFRNSKLQPFRSIIRGYTGVRKSPSPREHWKYSREDIECRLKKLSQFLGGLHQRSPAQLNQFLRGEHYFYLDFLMGNHYTDNEDMVKVYQYFFMHISFLQQFLSRILSKGIAKTFINPQLQTTPQNQWQKTYDLCYYQLIDGMYNVAGLQDRLSSFMRHNQDLIKQIVGQYQKHEYYVSTQVQRVKLFDVIVELIKQNYQLVAEGKKQIKLPFSWYFSLFQLFEIVQSVFLLQNLKEKGRKLFQCVFQLVSRAIESIQPNDMKQSQIDREVEHIVGHSKYIAPKYNLEQMLGRWVEDTRMQASSLLLRCDKLQKKIKGISKLKEVAQNLMKEQSHYFSIEAMNQMLHSLKILEQLFMQNEHIEIYKKSTELMTIFYKFQIIGVQELCYIWNTSITKHPLIVSQLYQFWIEMAYLIQYQDIVRYAQTATNRDVVVNEENCQYIAFYFQLVLAIVNNNFKAGDFRKGQSVIHDGIDKMLEESLGLAYHILLQAQNQNFFSHLVSKYGTIIIESPICKELIQQTYNSLSDPNQFKVCLNILHQVYVSHERINLYIPEDIRMRLIQCLRNPIITCNDITHIFQVLNVIITFNSRHNLKNKEFQILWQYFQGSQKEFKAVFYHWILPIRADQIHDTFSSHLNLGFNNDLKKFILTQILSNQRYLNYKSLTKKELSIVLQIMQEVNLSQGRIQKKKILEGYRFIYRLKTIELISQNLLWLIFQTCKNDDVIHYLNRYLIKFYFYFAPCLNLQMRKSRIDQIMEKIMENIRGGYAKGNFKVVKHSLDLLRAIFELVKEDKYNYQNQSPSPYKVKIQVKYLANTYKFDISENQTVMYLKYRVAERLKLKINCFKMVVREDEYHEQLDYSFKNTFVSILRKCPIQVVQIAKDQQTVASFISSFINQDLQTTLISMLQNQLIASEVYGLIEELDMGLNKMNILDKLQKILQKYSGVNRKMENSQIYYHMLQIKILSKMLEKQYDTDKIITSSSLQRMIDCLKCKIYSDYQLHFEHKLICFFIKILRKTKKESFTKIEYYSQHFFSSCCQVSSYLVSAQSNDHNVKQIAIKLHEGAVGIIEHFLGYAPMIRFLFNQREQFTLLANQMYLNNQIQFLRMLYSDKLNRYLASLSNQNGQCFQPDIQQFLLQLYIDDLYFKVRDKQYLCLQGQNQRTYQFSINLAKIITVVDPSRIDKTQVFQPIEGRGVSLLDCCLEFIQKMKQIQPEEFNWHYLLTGHLYILIAIFQHKPYLIDSNIISFILENCLALSGPTTQPLLRKMDNINQTLKCFCHLILITNKVHFLFDIIQALEPCHKLQLWRTSTCWNVSHKYEAKQTYRGLINPGCICYMNSLLQQFFMIDQFKLSLLELDTSQNMIRNSQDRSSDEEPPSKMNQEYIPQISSDVVMLDALKQLFLKLEMSEENNIDPTYFARTLKNNEKRPMIRFNQQMDIDQFASILFQKIEKGVREKGQENFVKKLFGGVYVHQIISKECSHRSEREEEFFSMSLQVKQNINKSLESLVKSELLDGGNKYHCQKCDKKVKAQKLQTIKQLPPYLILCLKRFEFDYEIDAKIKINDYCQFPHQLNLSAYSQQQIMKNKGEMLDENDERIEQAEEYFQYKLRGVVVHTGSADSGHYYSFIQNSQGNWFQFNDEDVIPFDVEKLPDQAFGCRPSKYQNKTKNAYLMIYERIKWTQKKQFDEKAIYSRQAYQPLISRILKRNGQLRKEQIVFSQEYEHMIRRMEIAMNQIKSQNPIEADWHRFYLSYYFLIKVRKDNLQYFMSFSQSIQNHVMNNYNFCKIFLKCFASPRFIEEMFIYNPVREKCRVFEHMFGVALEAYCRKNIDKLLEDKLIEQIFQCLKSIFVQFGLVGELLISLRKFLQFLSEENQEIFIYKIIENFTFEQVLFNLTFNITFDKKTKQINEDIWRNKQRDIEFLAPLHFYGKKMNQNNHSQTWKILTLLLTLNNMFIQQPENKDKEELDLYINNLQYFKRCLSTQNFQSKIMSTIIQSSSNRAIYYFYLTMKELGYHIKIFPCIQRAIKDYESIKYRPFFLYLEHAINDRQNGAREKQKVIDAIEKAYKFNEKYFLETDSIHQWIIRLASTNQQFLELLSSRVLFLIQVYDKIARSPCPTITDLAKKFRHHINERVMNRSLGILVTTDIKQYEQNSTRMKMAIQMIKNDEFDFKQFQIPYQPPQDQYDISEKVQVYDFGLNKWIPVEILENIFGQLTVKTLDTDQNTFQFWQESEKIRKIQKKPSEEMMAEQIDDEREEQSYGSHERNME